MKGRDWMKNFAMAGVAGFVAPRHLQAIKDVGGTLVAALDPHDAVGILDKYDRKTAFFTAPERFERYLQQHPVDWLTVCSPNHLHDTHARMGMQSGANVLCEKPLTLTPWNLDALEHTERTTDRRVYTVLQLRHLKSITALKAAPADGRRRIQLKYVTPRGAWYQQSWKGDVERSGGLITNIGIHMLDLLLWLYGSVDTMHVSARTDDRVLGSLTLARADVEWYLSINENDTIDGRASRSLIIDNEIIELSDGFTDLHTTVYKETLAGRGHGIADARPAVELAHRLRYLPVK